MAKTKPWTVKVRQHPGSSADEIRNEPHWHTGRQHHVGFKDRDGRRAGITHATDDYHEEIEEARQERERFRAEMAKGDLVNFREVIENQEDFHLRHPENKSLGWRYVLETTEDKIKNQEWPANIKKREKEEEKRKEEEKQKKEEGKDLGQDEQRDDGKGTQEHEWRRSSDQDKHNDAYATDGDKGDKEQDDLAAKYSPQELALLRSLEHESQLISNLKENDGKRTSPQHHNITELTIDEADQFSPDNWLPRSSHLIRLTGKHPLNAEPQLSALYEAGLVTPNELHYVRNHGAVPRLLWELHELDIEYAGKTNTYRMDDIAKFDTINIPVALACDGNRRKELNMIKKSKGFGWGSGGVSCAYWKGPLLRDVLLSAGIPEDLPSVGGKRNWVNFEGADDPSDGKYSTCIPLEYAMCPQNDVMLAYEMNDVPLPPDHGYPIRLLIPGYVGGRCVKWLKKIWISDQENDSHYHIWDNRVLPAFVTEKDGPFAETLFKHPSTACNEQALQSIVVKPAQGEKIPISKAHKGQTYRVEGIAYDGGGHEVQRVEVSLDGGVTWLYCIRRFPEYPVRHGNKFWSWLHWHVDIELTHLVRAKSIIVRCFNVFKNTQPRDYNWNIMGMMNNAWYEVRPEIIDDEDSDLPVVLFRHPTEPGTGDGGWMKPSQENQIAQAKQDSGAPGKQFTREEIEKHDSDNDCWIVVDNKVYDATSVLDWHPGGKAAILGHAGKVHLETSNEFASVHDDYAYQKLNECILGTVTDKAAKYMKQAAEDAAKQDANQSTNPHLALQKHRWVACKLAARKNISDDTRTYTFSLPDGQNVLGLGPGQHVQIGFHFLDRMMIRSYTPTRPLLPQPSDPKKRKAQAAKTNGVNGHKSKSSKGSNTDTDNDEDISLYDGNGTFDLTVKTYFPSEEQPGGALTNILDCMPIGEEVEIRGPTGEIVYTGNGNFTIGDEQLHFDRVSLVLGGSGLTPGYSLLARILLTEGDATQIRVVDANKSETDILLREDLDRFVERSNGQLEVTHVLSHPSDEWKGLKGHVNEDIIKEHLFAPAKDSVALLCGPPAMIQKAALPALKDWGYVEDENVFGF